MKRAGRNGWTGRRPRTPAGLLSTPLPAGMEAAGYGCSLPGLAGFTGRAPPGGTGLHRELPAGPRGPSGRPVAPAPA